MSRVETRQDEAIGWVVRVNEPGFAGWDALTLWLESDDDNALAYDAVALADAATVQDLRIAPTIPRASNDDSPVRWSMRWPRRSLLGWSAAAAVVAVVGYPLVAPAHSTYRIETASGERRSVTLADGSRIDLNGGTQLALDRDAPRSARLETGEAVFSVRHDAADPFVVTAGNTTLQDVGTVFNLARTGDVTSVAVAEGGVMFDPGGRKLLVGAGRTLEVADSSGRAQVGTVDAGGVGGWRTGRLVYRDASLIRVAADLSRSIGEPVTTAPDIADQSFSGVIMIDRNRNRLFARLDGLLGVSSTHSEAGWRLTSRNRATH